MLKTKREVINWYIEDAGWMLMQTIDYELLGGKPSFILGLAESGRFNLADDFWRIGADSLLESATYEQLVGEVDANIVEITNAMAEEWRRKER